VLLGQAQSFRDVADDDGRALRVRQFVVRVEARLVLREIDRVLHLSDVMVERPRTHQLRLGPNLVGYLRSQVAHGDGVLERARRLLAQFAKQRVVCIGKLEERHRRGESEGLLDHQHQGIGEEKEETIDREVVVDGAVELRDIIRLDELEREIDQRRGSRDEDRREEYLTPSRQFAERVDCHEARHQLYGDKLILVFHGHGTDEDGRDVLDEGRSRVHEDAPEDGRDGKRDDIDAEKRVLHHEGRQEREEDEQGVEHGYGSRFREVVLAEECQIEGEERDEQQDVDGLSRYGRSQFVLRGALLRHGTLVGVEHEHHPRGDDVALGDDALPLEHHSACLRDEAEIVVEFHFAPASVVAEVGRDEIVEVASLQLGPHRHQTVVEEEVLVGAERRQHAIRGQRHGLFARHDADGRRRVAIAILRQLGGVEHAALVDLVQPMGDDLDVVARQSRYAVLELLMKCLERLLLHAVVPVEVGLEAFAHGVALILQGRLRLEYGEVDGGDQSAVRPRLALAIVQKPAAVAGQKQDDDGHARQHERYARKDGRPVAGAVMSELLHDA